MSLQLGHCMFSRLIVTLRETFITKPAIIGTRKCEIPILDTLISFEKLKDQKSMLAVFKLTPSNFLFTSPSHLSPGPHSTLLIGCRWRKHEWFLLSGDQITHLPSPPTASFPFTAGNPPYLDNCIGIVTIWLANPILLIGWFCCAGCTHLTGVCVAGKTSKRRRALLFLKEKLFQIWLKFKPR